MMNQGYPQYAMPANGVTGPSAVQPQFSPQMLQRLNLIRQLQAQRGNLPQANTPVAGGMRQMPMQEGAPMRPFGQQFGMAGGSMPQPTITPMAQPARPAAPVTTQGMQPVYGTNPNSLARRMAVFRG